MVLLDSVFLRTSHTKCGCRREPYQCRKGAGAAELEMKGLSGE